MSKNRFVIKLVLTVMMIMTTWVFQAPVTAWPLPNRQQAIVFHSSPEKLFVAGKDIFKFRHFTNDSGLNLETLAITEITLAPNYKGFLLKKHIVNVDDNLYTINGEVQCFIGQSNEAIKLKTGDMVRIPSGTPYGCKASGSEPSNLLLVNSSTALENLITEIGTPVEQANQATNNLDMVNVAAAAKKYGIEFLN